MIDLWRAQINELVAEHKIDVSWDNVRPRAMGRRVWIPHITDEASYAVCLHELGHAVSSGPCPGTDPHYREPDIVTSHACLECEVLATEFAAQNARPAYTQQMHDRLSSALRSYRRVARGWPAAKERLDRLVNIGYRAEKQRRATSSLDYLRWRHARALLSEPQKLDLKIQAQREMVALMRAKRRV